MSSQDALRSAAKDLALLQHAEKSDAELQRIVMDNHRIILGLGTDQRSVLKGYQLLGEIDACNELLETRKKLRAEIKQGKKEWQERLQKRKDDALLNLKAAVTPNGQLVQAILEDEESLTKEDLSGWCEELGALEDADLEKLLTNLTADGVLDKEQEGRYRLKVLCREEQQWTLADVQRVLDRGSSYHKNLKLALFEILSLSEEPQCAAECVETAGYMDDMLQEWDVQKSDFDERSIDQILSAMTREGMLTRAFRAGGNSYYTPSIIGEGVKQ